MIADGVNIEVCLMSCELEFNKVTTQQSEIFIYNVYLEFFYTPQGLKKYVTSTGEATCPNKFFILFLGDTISSRKV